MMISSSFFLLLFFFSFFLVVCQACSFFFLSLFSGCLSGMLFIVKTVSGWRHCDKGRNWGEKADTGLLDLTASSLPGMSSATQ